MRLDQKSEVGSYLSHHTGCEAPCNKAWWGLNYLTVELIQRKKSEFAETIAIDYADQLSGLTAADVLQLIDAAIEDEGRLRGLGDVVYRLARAVGIKRKGHCGCGRRRAGLNRLIPFRKQG